MTPPLPLDPVAADALAAAVCLVLVVGALHKLRDRAAFEVAVAQYRLLPEALVPAIAWALPALEAVAGVALLLAATRPVGVALAVAMIAAVTAAVVVNLLRGRTDIECGCGGVEGRQPLSWGLVTRNAALVAGVLLAGTEPAARPLNWLDSLTLAGASLALYGAYAVVSQLLANRPLLAELRSHR